MTTLDPFAARNGGAPFTPPATEDEAREYIRANGIEFLFAQFVDMHGKPNAKLVPASHLDDLLDGGRRVRRVRRRRHRPAPERSPDMAAMPDVRSLTPLPFRPEVARFACDVHVEGEEWPYCPRTILRRQLDRAKALGYEFKIGCELEYFLVRKKDDGTIELADPLDTLDQPCYDMRALTRSLDFVSQVARNITRSGGTTTRPTTRTPTASSSRTSSTPTR